jgi:hypothetical protein
MRDAQWGTGSGNSGLEAGGSEPEFSRSFAGDSPRMRVAVVRLGSHCWDTLTEEEI